ncbi:metal transporter CNNM [Entomortierella parvispora]|uniref:Metal transporter CNNM n=1 Tax=Entomortierella parvispora TaxID=205924 RepID=A0A9P3LZK5_9FUNG|nr:metal transporter CNNM [Entomortierella parvispora]
MDNREAQDHSVAITIEKDSSSLQTCSSRASRPRNSALGLKNIIIYVLVFTNLLLCSKLFSTWSRASTVSTPKQDNDWLVMAMVGTEKPEHEGEDAGTPEFWLKMGLIVFLVLIGGVFAGLTIGLMGLDETNLHVLMASGSPTEQIHAETVYKLLSRGKHWVLVTLLLGNVIVNETLPVVLDSELGGGIVAILISTLLIVIFGEIIPQAVCARYGLAIGSYCAKPMLVLMYIMSPVAYPIAKLLDSWLGVHHGTTYRRTELKTLVSLHQMDGIGELTDDEVTIIASVLDLKEKRVSMVMTPLDDVFTLSEDAILNEQLMEEIVSAGYSRIPIHRHDDANNFIGMLLVKRLITYDPEDHTPVRQFTLNSLPEAAPNTSCLDILNFFQEGRSHMAMVTSEPGGFGVPVGVITLEDVIEELLGEEIVDESDVYVDVHNKIRVIRKPARNVSMIKNLKTLLQSPAISDSTPLLKAAGAARSSTMPIDNKYMATGKTILQNRNPSTAALLDHKIPNESGDDPRTPLLSQQKMNGDEREVVHGDRNGKTTTAPVKDAEIEIEAAAEPEEGFSVTIEVPDVSGTYSINPPIEIIAAASEAAEETRAPVPSPAPALAAAAPTPAAPVASAAPALTEDSNVPESVSSSTLLNLGEGTSSPSPSGSKKKKNKKKKTK